ncbi:MAG: GUN4 domain-containing protein [Microcoleus sp. SM1_3_4]|nr:GUN4 domain-containing protein [Microcoleus sp. SM1_3_4]
MPYMKQSCKAWQWMRSSALNRCKNGWQCCPQPIQIFRKKADRPPPEQLVIPSISPKVRIPVPPTQISPPPINLISARGIDYRKLDKLLAAEKWKKADAETSYKMLEVAGKQEEDWLTLEDMREFPCEDLRTIDRLWVQYSRGHFGFSVQRKIYQNLGGTHEYDSEVWQKFGDAVGWRKNGEWLYYNDLSFQPMHQQVIFLGAADWREELWVLVGSVFLLLMWCRDWRSAIFKGFKTSNHCSPCVAIAAT